jgi:hypothetical protein
MANISAETAKKRPGGNCSTRFSLFSVQHYGKQYNGHARDYAHEGVSTVQAQVEPAKCGPVWLTKTLIIFTKILNDKRQKWIYPNL